jgi:hypothetical protein
MVEARIEEKSFVYPDMPVKETVTVNICQTNYLTDVLRFDIFKIEMENLSETIATAALIVLLFFMVCCHGCTLPRESYNYVEPTPSFIWQEPLMWTPGQIILEK